MASPMKYGNWVWDDINNMVHYQSKEALQKSPSRVSGLSNATMSISGRKNIDCEIMVMDAVDNYTQTKFRKHFQRKVKVIDIAVATIQDVKDVAIFTSKVDDLFPEFIKFFHTEAMDRFLRSMIVYFQYYLQVWSKMQSTRKEAARKLRQPIVTLLENEERDNLADLRSMVARDYAAILMGVGDAKKFHHMNNKNNDSLSDKDRRLFETLIFMAIKVVWIALFRKNLPLIEKETNRLLRTNNFSPVEHSGAPIMRDTPEERRVLVGKAFKNEKKLLHRSPIIQQILFENHDYRLLSIGINNNPMADARIRYLEIAYAAPEELLVEAGIAVGILGVQRKYLDAMLKPLDISTTVKRTSLMKIGQFNIPPKSVRYSLFSDTLSENPCKFQESQTTKNARISQCKKWITYLDMGGVIVSELVDIESNKTIRASIAASPSSGFD
ncbi:uncharacterized protein LOC126738127 [Anthonomus grandis grandis]|uniref:uncharacterized protein LOC126738127 n=1 Tax=Anthonomus grandis grandis TaxID=2921223 RepID=UPI0021668D5C|nr:uncharacterized protein LOC126738127 [Anthonomus grandis grandis]